MKAFHDLQPGSPGRTPVGDETLVGAANLSPPEHIKHDMTGASLMMGLAGSATSVAAPPHLPAAPGTGVPLSVPIAAVAGGVPREHAGGAGPVGADATGAGPIGAGPIAAGPVGAIGNGSEGAGGGPQPAAGGGDGGGLAKQPKKAEARKRMHKVRHRACRISGRGASTREPLF